MPAIREKPASTTQQPIHPPRDPNAQPTHPLDQRIPIARLDQQMHMIPLHRKLDNPK
jgi:hypothetical protein